MEVIKVEQEVDRKPEITFEIRCSSFVFTKWKLTSIFNTILHFILLLGVERTDFYIVYLELEIYKNHYWVYLY